MKGGRARGIKGRAPSAPRRKAIEPSEPLAPAQKPRPRGWQMPVAQPGQVPAPPTSPGGSAFLRTRLATLTLGYLRISWEARRESLHARSEAVASRLGGLIFFALGNFPPLLEEVSGGFGGWMDGLAVWRLILSCRDRFLYREKYLIESIKHLSIIYFIISNKCRLNILLNVLNCTWMDLINSKNI